MVIFYLAAKYLWKNSSIKVNIEHVDKVKITISGLPSKKVVLVPLTTIAMSVESDPIIDDAYPAIWPKGFIANAFKFPKIKPKKEKLIIINIENQTRFNEK